MLHEVRVPKLGMSTVEVDVVEWLVREGQEIQVGDPLVRLESEKATVVLESEYAGVLAEVLVRENETTTVGSVLCRIARKHGEAGS